MSDGSRTSGQSPTLLLAPGEIEHDGQQGQQIQILSLLSGRYHWVVLLALALGAALAATAYFAVTPVYTSTGVLRVLPEVRPVLHRTEATDRLPEYDSYVELQASLLKSPEVVQLALSKKPWQDLGLGTTTADMVAFRRSLEIDRESRQQIIEVGFTDKDPAIAAAGISSLIEAYLDIYGQQYAQEDSQIVRRLEQRRNELRQTIDSLREQQQQMIREYGVDGTAQRYEFKVEELSRVEALLRQTQMVLDAAEAGEAPDSNLTDVNLQELAATDPQLRSLLSRRDAIDNLIHRYTQLGLGEKHREMIAARSDLDAINRQIEVYLGSFRQGTLGGGATGSNVTAPLLGVGGSVEELRARVSDLQRMKEQLESEVVSLGEKQANLQRIGNQLESVTLRLDEVEQRMDTLNLEASGADRIEVISRGTVPTQPSNDKKRKQLAALGGMAGAGFGVGLVVLFGLLDSRFRRVDEAEMMLPSVRMLGILPTLPEGIAESEQVAVASHCVHHIRTLLQISPNDSGAGRVVVITSPGPGSGKTSLSTALGLSFAASGASTLLIDCDIVGSGLSRRVGNVSHRSLVDVLRKQGVVSESALENAQQVAQASKRSLIDVLTERGELSSADLAQAKAVQQGSRIGLLEACDGEVFSRCVADTGIDNLSLLPVGAALPHQAGSLSPKAIRKLFNEARQNYDAVIVDTGPILGSIEASMAVAEADAVVMVVSRGDQKQLVLRSIEQLRSIGAPIAGVVFNHASAADVAKSSYASVASVAPVSAPVLQQMVDPDTTTRFGPVGSAVASCSRPGTHTPVVEAENV